ncbi:KTSC domain-containing protein [Maribacter stanieri]|uniref:KTSC domain-containing protein n=1 Tax=Maribacter stanieri TaxID=440514 RepID=UPI002495600E|nr:KTSC domain-containing protein [Maribacter stanieri]
MLKLILQIFTLIIFIACQSNDCIQLPSSFQSHEQGVSKVMGSSFTLTDQVNTSKSSWIRGARYYSCDSNTGFLVLMTDSSNYIHQAVPLSIWEGFKNAGSFGSYYNQNLKGRYQLRIN